MKNQNTTFTSIMLGLKKHYDLQEVFNAFLEMTIAILNSRHRKKNSANKPDVPAHAQPATPEEMCYLHTLLKYASEYPILHFPEAFRLLQEEMEASAYNHTGNDILGEFYQNHILGMAVLFPFDLCIRYARRMPLSRADVPESEPLRILDPACGSGRMLLARAAAHPEAIGFYGIDADLYLIKITAINLFLAGLRNCELGCLNPVVHNDYVAAFRITEQGIFPVRAALGSQLKVLSQTDAFALDILYT